MRWTGLNTMVLLVLFHDAIAEINRNEISSHPAWTTLDSFDCGFSAADRIIGGVNAALGQFPWIVRLGYVVEGEEELDWMCGGVLVTDRFVVTAAHCVQTAGTGYKLKSIRVGEYNTQTDPDCQLGVCAPPIQDRSPKIIKSYPEFNKPPLHNDVAVIQLDIPVDINDYVTPICLPRGDQLDTLTVGQKVVVAGWGKMNMSTEERAKILQYVYLPIVKPETCDFFGRGFKLSASEICAGAQYNKDACGGDSGGPLMKLYDTSEGPKSFLVGVVSFGPTVCGIRKPGVYSSVFHFLKWILDNII